MNLAVRSPGDSVRLALGAAPREIMRLVLGQAVRLTFAGVALGLAGGLLFSRLMEGTLFGLTTTSGVAVAAVGLAVSATALLASYLPAAATLRIDPANVLRHQ